VKTPADLARLAQQRTWDKDLVLWVGSENRLREVLGAVPVVDLDLLDLFDPDKLPMDDDETRAELRRQLRKRLQTLTTGPGNRAVLLVRSVSLLARYQAGVREFYDWFCNDFGMVVLTLSGLPAGPIGSAEVVCVPERLLEYFRGPDVVKEVYGEAG
jgi:hypothetical protein